MAFPPFHTRTDVTGGILTLESRTDHLSFRTGPPLEQIEDDLADWIAGDEGVGDVEVKAL